MQLFRYVEQGSIPFLWVSATNPAVSLPQLPRISEILAKAELFLVVQDLYLTETARARRHRSARGRLGREDGDVHQRDAHGAPLREGGRAAR